jgi:DNA polymerase III epsilon subunit family exonuclease
MTSGEPHHSLPLKALDEAIERLGAPTARVAPRATSLSARAAQLLAEGPCDPHTLMRLVCRVDRLHVDAAARMADVLLGNRPEFVQLDDDRWALIQEGQVLLRPASPAARAPAQLSGPAQGLEPLRLDTLRFAVVDVETTGSHAGLWDRVTEVAIVPVEAGRVGEPWAQLVNPDRPIPPMITALTGISDAMVARAPRFGEIAEEVAHRLGGRIFTAHNAAFDHRFVDAELSRSHGGRLDGAALCTVRLTRRLVPALTRRSLDRVCTYFGIRIDGRHRAGGDALATAQVLVRLLDIAGDRGIEHWPDLVQTLSASPSRRTARGRVLPSSVQKDSSA